jgi:DNA-binding transcriptional regulator YiaG
MCLSLIGEAHAALAGEEDVPMTPLQFTRRRKKLFRSQQKAAEALGVTQQALSNWETGRREVPLWLVKFLECLEFKLLGKGEQ